MPDTETFITHSNFIKVRVHHQLHNPDKPVIIHSMGFNTVELGLDYHNVATDAVINNGCNNVHYLYPEREPEGFTTDLLISSGSRSLQAVYDWVIAQGYKRIWLLGVSYGGNIATELALDSSRPIERLILINPAIKYYDIRANSLGETAMKQLERNGSIVLKYDEGDFRSSLRFFEEAKHQKLHERFADITVPIDVFQGALDPLIPIADTESIAGTNSQATFHRLENSGHAIDNPVDAAYLFAVFIEKLREA